MSIKIAMPALSPTMEKGTLAKWLVKEGSAVRSGDAIATIETDKASVDFEAADAGVIAKILVPAGTRDVAVNTVIAVLAEENEDTAEVAKSAASEKMPAVAYNQGIKAVDIPVEVQSASVSSCAVGKGKRIFVSPLARRLAAESGLDLTQIAGSGTHGRIIQRDIEKARQNGTALQGGAALSKSAMSDEATLKLFRSEDYDMVSHTAVRQIIARRLVESKQWIPHFYVSADCNIDSLLKLRSEINASAPHVTKDCGTVVPEYKVSVNDMIVKAVALALKRVPGANVSWLDSGMMRHKHSDVAVAVSIPGGVVTPIVRRVEEKSLIIVSNEMKDLIKRAQQMRLKPEEYQGGTSTVSNMGMFGVKSFSAIVNPPQSTIFAVGAGEKRAVVRNGALVAGDVMSVTLSVDHRAVDGALAAELLRSFKNIIENPMTMLL